MRTDGYCNLTIPSILKTILVILILFIAKSVVHSFLIKYHKLSSIISQISFSTLEIFLYISYYFSTIIAYYVYKDCPNTCFLDTTFPFFTLFVLILLGMITMVKQLVNIIVMCLTFPFMVHQFIIDPKKFYLKYGIDPEIVKNIPTYKAHGKYCILCVICTENINEGEDIVILKCPGRHCFHSECIKQWLLRKVNCPTCRNEDVL